MKFETTEDERRDLWRFPSSRHAKGVTRGLRIDFDTLLREVERLEGEVAAFKAVGVAQEQRYQRLLRLVEPFVRGRVHAEGMVEGNLSKLPDEEALVSYDDKGGFPMGKQHIYIAKQGDLRALAEFVREKSSE